ncbi:MAG TPA: bifunctional methionine sulfoxide reductase B/A protein [Polyangia bacterium]|nr:bifunctional methionine sulfoxide reductase B/A protein [Polyangia bacterium]
MKQLTPEEERVIAHKGTEAPFSGEYLKHSEDGTYTCRRCGQALFRSADKFDSGCGWPSFDDALPGAVREHADPDGLRTEIVCASCGAHLGHVFTGEGFTQRSVRHCVNSISLEFTPAATAPATSRALFAGGCFWGVEHHFSMEPGVLHVTSGYTGGHVPSPIYEQVCEGNTGHLEAVEVVFDPKVTSFEKLARLFFEIHDPTQVGGQGPDIGEQYRSAIFVVDDEQRRVAKKLIALLREQGLDVATEVREAGPFWPAEAGHQDYYASKGTLPYCHVKVKRF